MQKNSRIILSLDVTNYKKAMDLVENLKDLVDAVKVGYPLVLETGVGIIKDISNYLPVICDFKIADIPNTNSMIAEIAKKYGAEGIISHAFTGSDSLEAVVKTFHPGYVFAVVEMTHPGAMEYMQNLSMEMAKMAISKGVKGFIVPGTRPERIRLYRALSRDLILLAPGIGAQGGEAKMAIESGADYIIVGRSIYQSKDPVKATKDIMKSIS